MMILSIKKEGLKDCAVYANGKRVNLRPSAKHASDMSAQIEVDGQLRLEVFKMSPFSFDNWFLWAALYWIIGIFGLFTPRYPKKCTYLYYSLTADITSDAQITIADGTFGGGDRPVCVISSVPFEESYEWRFDKKAQTRRRIYRIFTAVFWIALAALATYFIYKNLT